MKSNKIRLLVIATNLLFLNGCASNLQGDVYSREDARQVQAVELGIIEDTRFVVLEGKKNQGSELVIRTNDDRVISVVQGYEANHPFKIGDKVRILYVNGEARVAKRTIQGRKRY